MKKKVNKIFSRSFWSLSTMFTGILLAILLVGEQVAKPYEGWINSFLNINPFVQVDDSSNATPDVMYYPSDFSQWRWHWDEEENKYVYERRWNEEGLYSYIRSVTKNVDTEGSVLLKNESNALPLTEGSKVSIFGTAQFPSNYVVTGQGSGAHAANTNDTLRACLINNGVEVNENLYNAYERIAPSYAPKMFNTFPEGDLNYVEFSVNEIPYDKIESSVNDSISEYGDAAIYIISRLGSENGDTNFSASNHVDNNYLDLNNEEVNVLNNLKSLKEQGKIKKIVLVLNSCSSMQFKTISQYPIDAILSVGTGGTSSYSALADVLTGKADPNGHLADTYVYDNYSAPATVNTGNFTYTSSSNLPSTETYAHNDKYVVYQEGVYVGYRYYETRYEDMVLGQGNAVGDFGSKNSTGEWIYSQEVAYPFGYGLSYADFSWSGMTVSENKGIYNVRVTVENTSDTYSGKDVVQLYLQKPYSEYDVEHGIEKPAVELVGFAKTKLLEPGEKQTIEIIINEKEFTSYDADGAGTYILEKGDYYLTLASDSHAAVNNIIDAKVSTNSKYDDADGNPDFVYKVNIKNDDFTTYSISETTGNKITNQFDNADINRYENAGNNKVTYLSRKDWLNTYPNEPVSIECTNEGMIQDMQYGQEIEESEDAVMPTFGADNGISLIDLMYEDFDSPKWDLLLDQLTIDEAKSLMLLGANVIGGATSPINAPGGNVHDGPAGIRDAEGSVAYPSQIVMANTFNTSLIKQLGEAFGMEMQYLGYIGLYGPGANIHRTAFGGRNFEYFSEDPVLAGLMLKAELSGFSDMGIITYTKHFVLNDQERNRYGVATFANEQSIREIYLKAFQYAIENQESETVGLMTSFNRIGCTWAGAHKGLLTGVLRDEWGFKGSTMTDAAVAGYMGVNGNTLALANAVIAGQTIWLSDVRTQGFGGYENNPIVAQAIRKACKYNLYAQLRSSAMNGIKSGTKIIEITPWWKDALHIAQIAVGIITIATLGMAIASFIVVEKSKREISHEESK